MIMILSLCMPGSEMQGQVGQMEINHFQCKVPAITHDEVVRGPACLTDGSEPRSRSIVRRAHWEVTQLSSAFQKGADGGVMIDSDRKTSLTGASEAMSAICGFVV